MKKQEIRQLTKEELFQLSLQRGKHKRYTLEALYAQELLYTEMFYPREVINEQNPFDYEPFNMED